MKVIIQCFPYMPEKAWVLTQARIWWGATWVTGLADTSWVADKRRTHSLNGGLILQEVAVKVKLQGGMTKVLDVMMPIRAGGAVVPPGSALLLQNLFQVGNHVVWFEH